MVAVLVRRLSPLLLIALTAMAAPQSAERATIIDVDHLNIYGATVRLARDNYVPGGQVARVSPRFAPGEDWSSGMALPLPMALNAGERVSSVFWARADRPTAVPVTLQGRAPAYASFATTVAHLTPRWRRFVISGVAPADFPAGSQGLTVQLGKAQTEVSLGPVIITLGRPDETCIEAAFAGLRSAWLSEDVSITSSPGVVLAATLRTPTSHGSRPFPAVLLLGGSGPGWRGGPSPLMARLLGDGIAVLEYDKRGNGKSTGEFVDSLGNMETDATAAVKYLRNRADIDGSRIALVGHSQGGAVAPAVAAQDSAIAGVVMLAGPAAPPTVPGPGHEINLVIMKDMLAKAGSTPVAIEQVSQASERLFEAETGNATPSEIARLREAAIQGFIACKFDRARAEGALATVNAIVLEAMNTHFDLTLASLHAPVLALYAAEDEHVSTPRNMPAAKSALSANPDATVVEIADVNHGFRHVTNVSALEKSYSGPIGAPEAIRLIGDWLDAHLHPAKAVTASLK